MSAIALSSAASLFVNCKLQDFMEALRKLLRSSTTAAREVYAKSCGSIIAELYEFGAGECKEIAGNAALLLGCACAGYSFPARSVAINY